MRKLLIALAAVAALEAPALACSCLGPVGNEQEREFAHSMARTVVALAEVTQIEPMDIEAMRPDRYRVLRVLVGEAPETFFAATKFERHPGGLVSYEITTCDAAPALGEREVVALYPPSQEGDTGYPLPERENEARIAAARASGTLEIGGTCTHLFLQRDGVIDMVREEARKLGRKVQ